MKSRQRSRILLSENRGGRTEQLELFAILNLGVAQSLASGALTPSEALQRFYHAANCLYVRRTLRSKEANEVMGRGAQLPDLFEGLDCEEARCEFYREIDTIRVLCLKLLAGSPARRLLSNRAAA